MNVYYLEPLNKKELYELFDNMHNGDLNARNVIAEHNLKLSIYVVSKNFSKVNYDKDDLISIANIGLMKAIDTFKYKEDVHFATYAIRCIQNEILMFLKKLKKYNNKVVRLHKVIGIDEDGNVLTIENTLCDIEDFTLKIEEEDLYNKVRRIVDNLPDLENEIIKLYFGFYGKRYTQLEIANKMNCCQSHISKTLTKVLKNIKTILIKNRLFYDNGVIIKKK